MTNFGKSQGLWEPACLNGLVDGIVDQDTDMWSGFLAGQYPPVFGFEDVVSKVGPPEKRARFGEVRRRLHDDKYVFCEEAVRPDQLNRPSNVLKGKEPVPCANYAVCRRKATTVYYMSQ